MKPAQVVLVVEYDGTRYHGFQWQVDLPTVQGELEQAIERLCEQKGRVGAASRTDTGVHAKCQVVSFWTKSKFSTMTFIRALNYYLPRDIVVKEAYRVNDDFNVRRDAVSREYCYYILNSKVRSPFSKMFAQFMPQMLNIEAMNKACQLMQGEHDFISFATSLENVRSTVRNVYQAGIDKRGDFATFRVAASSFLPHQVRNTVGLLTRLGMGKIEIGDFYDIMEAKRLGLATPMASARGLWLTKVNYPRPLREYSENL